MKKITVSLDEETHRSAKEWAAKRGMSVSALVREYLNNLPQKAPGPPEKTLSEVVADFRAKGIILSSSDNLPREKLYDRHALR